MVLRVLSTSNGNVIPFLSAYPRSSRGHCPAMASGVAVYAVYALTFSWTADNCRRLFGHQVPRKKVKTTCCASLYASREMFSLRCDGSVNKGAVSPMLRILFLRGMEILYRKLGLVSNAGLFSLGIDRDFCEKRIDLPFPTERITGST